ncbi:MAG: gluconate 2-dehydrogenase subunit 3 family protein [Acidobacteria bacterium]|nr:gluconate 2-dehydrogenase subunit 3 family protein [Acidobacteriota bacterium]
MKRREMLRTSMLGGAAAALTPALALEKQSKADAAEEQSELTPAQRGVDASDALKSANWKPLFLDEHQNATLIILSDLIIPATDTPGAKEALVNRYIDLVMAAETHENQKSFLNNLAYIDGESMRFYRNTFRYLSREDQDDLLHTMAYPLAGSTWTGEAAGADPGFTNFEQLKTHIAEAYYTSHIGMKELGRDDNFTHGVYQGCEHSDGSHK